VKNCDQFREVFEAYALGALDIAERAALEAHLATGCPDCAKAVEEARWLVSQLAYLAPEAAPSDILKGRLMQTVRAEAQAAKRLAPAQPRTLAGKILSTWTWVSSIAAALLIFWFYSYRNEQRLRREIQAANYQAKVLLQQRRDLEEELSAAKRQAVILTDPASVKIALASLDKVSPTLEAMWHSQLGIVLTGQKIPLPSGTRVLQLWLIPKTPGGKPIPSLTLRPDADGKFVLLVSNPPELMVATKALAITEEPAGGSPQPTTTPRWVGGVS
jgi:anti-sigma-K factor RskA